MSEHAAATQTVSTAALALGESGRMYEIQKSEPGPGAVAVTGSEDECSIIAFCFDAN